MTTCIQAIENGKNCKAPAIHGSRFCRHHDLMARKETEMMAAERAQNESRDHESFTLAPLTGRSSMLAAVNQVAQALASGRIKCSVAHTLLFSVKLAHRLLTEMENNPDAAISPAQAPATPQASRRTASRMAASSQLDPQKRAEIFLGAHQPSDPLVEEMMAQAHAMLSKSPKADPRFLRA